MASKLPTWMIYRTPGYSGIDFDSTKMEIRMDKIKKIYGTTIFHSNRARVKQTYF